MIIILLYAKFPFTGGHRPPLAAFGGHRRPLAAIGRHRRPLAAIGGHWQPLAAIGSHWRPSAVIGGHRRPLAAIGSHWQPLAAIGSLWLPSATIGGHRRPLAVGLNRTSNNHHVSQNNINYNASLQTLCANRLPGLYAGPIKSLWDGGGGWDWDEGRWGEQTPSPPKTSLSPQNRYIRKPGENLTKLFVCYTYIWGSCDTPFFCVAEATCYLAGLGYEKKPNGEWESSITTLKVSGCEVRSV